MADATGQAAEPAPDPERALDEYYDSRYNEYWRIGALVASDAASSRWWAIWLRIVAISLSAVTAAKGAFDTLAGVDNSCVLLTFTAIGIITTIVLGIETAFKFEKRSAELGALGSKIATAHRKLETNWLALAANKDDTARFEQKRDLLQRDDEAISELYAESPAAGFNLQEAYIAKYHLYLLERYVPKSGAR
jgi:hypothetical protein